MTSKYTKKQLDAVIARVEQGGMDELLRPPPYNGREKFAIAAIVAAAACGVAYIVYIVLT